MLPATFLATVSDHGDSREAIHVPTQVWMFHQLKALVGEVEVRVRTKDGQSFGPDKIRARLFAIRDDTAGRLIFNFFSDDLYMLRGQQVEVTIIGRPAWFKSGQ